MPRPALERMTQHLVNRGYEVESQANGDEVVYLARHPERIDFFIRQLGGGVLFWSFFRHSDHAPSDLPGFLALVNQTNRQVMVTRFYVDEEHDLVFEAWHPERYARGEFDLFIDAWHRDCMICLATEGLQRYLV